MGRSVVAGGEAWTLRHALALDVREDPNDPNRYLLAASKKFDHASMGDKKIVGTYRLVEEEEVTGVAQVTRVRKTRS